MGSIKTVEDYILCHSDRRTELEKLRELATSLSFKECIKWGMPTYTVDGKNVVSLGSFKKWSCLWFHQGAFLQDKQQVLENAQEGKTKGMRQWRFANAGEIDEKIASLYLEEAIKNQKDGKEIKPSKKSTKTAPVPELLQKTLNNDPKLNESFLSCTISQQNEFSNYIREAKREATKVSRLEKVKKMLGDGDTLKVLYGG